MARNVEIKARVSDLKRQITEAERLSDSEREVIDQEDTFFPCREGRLKLRKFDEERGEMIFYRRSDDTGPRMSRYQVCPVANPGSLTSTLSEALGVQGVVKKKRTLFLSGQTRIHFDSVENLGHFIELEVVLRPDQSQQEGTEIARRLMDRLGIREIDLLDRAYVDLLPVRGSD